MDIFIQKPQKDMEIQHLYPIIGKAYKTELEHPKPSAVTMAVINLLLLQIPFCFNIFLYKNTAFIRFIAAISCLY